MKMFKRIVTAAVVAMALAPAAVAQGKLKAYRCDRTEGLDRGEISDAIGWYGLKISGEKATWQRWRIDFGVFEDQVWTGTISLGVFEGVSNYSGSGKDRIRLNLSGGQLERKNSDGSAHLTCEPLDELPDYS